MSNFTNLASTEILSKQHTLTTQDVSRNGVDALFVQEFNNLHAIVDEMSNLRCRMNKIYRQNVLDLMEDGDSHSLFNGKKEP